MTDANGTRPTLAEARAAFASIPDFTTGRPDPSAAESERAVLGAAILSDADAQEALATLRPGHFGGMSRQLVFEAIERLDAAGGPVEPASVLADLAATGTLTRIGEDGLGDGGAYLHSLTQRAGSVGFHAPRIVADWHRRAAQLALRQCLQITETEGWDPDTCLDEIRKRIEDATTVTVAAALRPNSETVAEVLETLEREEDPALTTGYPDLDAVTGGLRPGELTVIGGRPGDGKSLLGLCIADHVGTRLGLPVLFASLEMTEEQLTCRRIAAEARVSLAGIVRRQLTDDDWQRISRANGRLLVTQLHVDDTPKQSFAHIRGRFKAMERAGNRPRLLVIDYLGFMASPVTESRQQAVADLARGAHDMSRELGIPIVLLAQLNRLVESRADRTPVMSDLRESGEIEQSADIVILLHRPDAHDREHPRAGEIDLVIRKNRQGAQSTVTLCFQGHYGRIVSMAPGDSEPDSNWSPSGAIRSAA